MSDSSKNSQTSNADKSPGIGYYLIMAILALLLIGTLTAWVLLQSAQTVALNPSFYKLELERAGVYDYAYQRLGETLKEQGGAQAEAFLGLSGISMEDVVTRAWLKSQAENLIDHAFAYINGNAATAELFIDLTEPKSRLYAAAQERIGQLPENGQAPATAMLEQYKTQFDEKIPDRVDLAAQAGGTQGLDQARTGVQTAKTATLSILVFALILAGIMVLLTRKRVHSMARWLGGAMLLSGGAVLVALSVGKAKAVEMLSGFGQTGEGQILVKIVTDGAQAVNDAAFPFAAVLIVLGVIGIAASFLLPKAQTQPAAAKAKTLEKAKDEKKAARE
ncbi:hypothetical protein HYV43_03925 [Candidatus Micrarchaeota archaeon]|nr:hypothetical protein [Candidatus Micrarchaeota archaeon]